MSLGENAFRSSSQRHSSSDICQRWEWPRKANSVTIDLLVLVWVNLKNGDDDQNKISSISGTNCDVLTAYNWVHTSMQRMLFLTFGGSESDKGKRIESVRNTIGYSKKQTRFFCLWETVTQFKRISRKCSVAHYFTFSIYDFSIQSRIRGWLVNNKLKRIWK